MPICAKLVHSVTLIAQPRSKHPLVNTRALKSGKLKIHNRATFGVLWFTDFGEKFWEACTTVDENAKVKLRSSGFDEMNWSVSFRFAGFKARLTALKYKGFFGNPRNSLIELKLGSENPNDLRMFLQALSTKFDKPPWVINNWKKAELKIGMNKEDIIDSWAKGMGREITEEETNGKSWTSSLFGSKTETSVVEEDEDVEVFENEDGEDVRMKIHGALEVEGEEYAIMSYADSFSSEFEIMKIERGKDDDVSYSAVDDEELYDDLSNAAQQHLESIGIL